MKTPHPDIAGCDVPMISLTPEQFKELNALASRMLTATDALLKILRANEPLSGMGIRRIQSVTAVVFGQRAATMTQRERGPDDESTPRQVAMYLTRRLTEHSLVEIGQAFGGRDHGTVMHAYKTVSARMANEPRLAAKVTAAEMALKGNSFSF
jgi:chromosomal replication initiator protein